MSQINPQIIVDIAAGVPAVIGILLLIASIPLRITLYKQERHCTAWTEGELMCEVMDPEDDSEGVWFPIYSFNAEDRKICKKGPNRMSRKKKQKTGRPVLVFYNPENPEEFFVKGEPREKLADFLDGAGFVLVIAAFCLAVMLCVIL